MSFDSAHKNYWMYAVDHVEDETGTAIAGWPHNWAGDQSGYQSRLMAEMYFRDNNGQYRGWAVVDGEGEGGPRGNAEWVLYVADAYNWLVTNEETDITPFQILPGWNEVIPYTKTHDLFDWNSRYFTNAYKKFALAVGTALKLSVSDVETTITRLANFTYQRGRNALSAPYQLGNDPIGHWIADELSAGAGYSNPSAFYESADKLDNLYHQMRLVESHEGGGVLRDSIELLVSFFAIAYGAAYFTAADAAVVEGATVGGASAGGGALPLDAATSGSSSLIAHGITSSIMTVDAATGAIVITAAAPSLVSADLLAIGSAGAAAAVSTFNAPIQTTDTFEITAPHVDAIPFDAVIPATTLVLDTAEITAPKLPPDNPLTPLEWLATPILPSLFPTTPTPSPNPPSAPDSGTPSKTDLFSLLRNILGIGTAVKSLLTPNHAVTAPASHVLINPATGLPYTAADYANAGQSGNLFSGLLSGKNGVLLLLLAGGAIIATSKRSKGHRL